MQGSALGAGRWQLTTGWTGVGMAAAVYAALAGMALWLAHQPGGPVSLWHADAAALGWLLGRPRSAAVRVLAGIAMADLAVRLLVRAAFGAGEAESAGVLPGLVAADVAAVALGAWLLRGANMPAQALGHAGLLLKALLLGALIPAFVGGVLAAGVAGAAGGPGSFGAAWLAWVEGRAVGSLALLPLVLLLRARGWAPVAQAWRRPACIAAVVAVVLLSWWAPSTLPFPFFYILIGLVVAASVGKFAGAALAVLACSLVMDALISSGGFRPPVGAGQLAGVLLFAPRIVDALAPGSVLLYLPLLLTMVPALLIATMLERIDAQVSRLADQEAHFRHLYQKTPVMMHSVDPQRRLLDVNEEWLARLGYDRAEVIGRPSTEFLAPESRRRAEETVIAQFMRQGYLRDMDYQMLTKTGEIVDVSLSAIWETDAQGRQLRTLSVLKDVTEQKRLAAELAAEKERIEHALRSVSHLAHHDGLTGLPNRVLFEDRVHQACQYGQRHQQGFAVVFMDLDHFKQVNDTLGHAVGDALLKLVAHRLTGVLRSSDTVCRLGGDEFVMLLSELETAQAAVEVAQKILREVALPCRLGSAEVAVGLSLGLALYPRDGREPATLMQHADAAMYRAKREGRNRCCVYNAVVDDRQAFAA